MIARSLLVAIAAGLIAGIVMTGAQQIKVVPLILHAEQYEDGGAAHENHAALSDALQALAQALDPVTRAWAHEGEAAEEGGMLFGMSRFGGTLTANLVAGAGFALLLAAVSLLSGRAITLANGVFWGGAAWLAVHFLPAIGLPPELPGFPAAELQARQLWWLATVLLSAGGLGLIALRGEVWAKVAGIVLIAAPHVWGAPQPDSIESAVPALLAAEFAVAALATTLVFWLALALSLGFLTERYGTPE